MNDQAPETPLPESPHFALQELAEGVYAALSTSRGAVGNAAIIDLGGATLILDTFMTPIAADALRAAAERLTRSPVRYVVNSHWHADHVLGNSSFPAETVVIATRITRDLMAERIPGRIKVLRQDKTDLEEDLLALQSRFNATQDETQRQALSATIRDRRVVLEALPQLALRLPDWTFEQQLVLHGARRTAEIITFGGGHTVSDAIVYLREENIAFVADLLFNSSHPWMGDGQPAAWRRSLDHIAALHPEVVVPGHGPVGTLADLDAMRDVVLAVEACVADLAARYPEPVSDLAFVQDVPIPPALAHLERPERFHRTLAALLQAAWGA